MSSQRILIIDDEASLRDLLKQALLRQGYQVDEADNGDSGLDKALNSLPDLILLDLMLPGMDGWEVCRRLREDEHTKRLPIIMLTARRGERDVVEGLSIGADDYVRKPFSLTELLARIAAQLRRSQGTQSKEMHVGSLTLDLDSQIARAGDLELALSSTEFQLLEMLAHRPGLPVPRERLLNCVWGLGEGDTRTLDTHISRLRKKLSIADKTLRIEALRSRGYRLTVEGERP